MVSLFFIFLWHLWPNLWWFISSGPLVIEPMLDYFWEGYDEWANHYVSRQRRRRFSFGLSILGIFIACFLAFSDVYRQLLDAQSALGKAYSVGSPASQEQAIVELFQANKRLQSKITERRHLSEAEKEVMKPILLAQSKGDTKRMYDISWAKTSEAGQYANDWMTFLASVGWLPNYRAELSEQYDPSLEISGVYLGIKDREHPSETARALATALQTAHIAFGVANRSSMTPDNPWLLIGDKP